MSFSFAPNYPVDNAGELRNTTALNPTPCSTDSNIKRLYINAARWVEWHRHGHRRAADHHL